MLPSLPALLAGLLFAIPAVAAQPAGKPPGKPMAMPVRTAVVEQRAVRSEATAVGTLLANESVVIRPEIAGRVTSIHFAEGQKVSRGAQLLSIDAAETQAQIAATRADLLLNQQRYDRASELYRKNFISSQALDEARSNLARSKARLAEDEARLAKSVVRAPFAGTLGLRLISPGAYVRAGDDVVRLEDVSVMKLDFRVPETFLPKLRRDQLVVVSVDAYPGRRFEGRTYALESSIDEKTRTVLVRARVVNPGGELKPGMFARVLLTLETRPDALVVPEEALVPRAGRTVVFKVVDGKALATEVETGARQPGVVEILKGLAAGDTVVTDGHQKLQPGMPVRALPGARPAESK